MITNFLGYGVTVTKSTLGRMLTILYALISIPCTSATLIYCGRLIVGIIKFLVVTFEGKLLKRKRIHYFQRKFITLQLLATVGSVMLFAYYHNSIVMSDDQNFLTSLYFAFVTVSTIGFGDIVPDPCTMLITQH